MKQQILAVLLILTLATPGCLTIPTDQNPKPVNYESIGFSATTLYLLTKDDVFSDKDQKAIELGYKIFHNSLEQIPDNVDSLRGYILDLIEEQIEDEQDKLICRLFFDQIYTRIENQVDFSMLTNGEIIQAIREIDKGIQGALPDDTTTN